MSVFGIDCGTEFTGYGVVEMDHAARTPRLAHLAAGRRQHDFHSQVQAQS